ncbi:MAG TPA: hypothetical protein VIG61_01800 [Fusobacterium sp.]|uniref:hypothetical protein n=1 Tax=Fusobacterium sp. TaxID=68766 RepID=UPI002F3F58AB
MYQKLKKMEDIELEEKIKKIEFLSDDALYSFLEGWFYEYYTHRSISREDFFYGIDYLIDCLQQEKAKSILFPIKEKLYTNMVERVLSKGGTILQALRHFVPKEN